MTATTATVYVKPTFASSGGGGAVVYIPFRAVTGLYSAINARSASTSRKKFWKSPKDAPWVDPQTGKPTVEFAQHWDYVVEKILGGSNNKTLPQVENLITYGQAEALFSSLIAGALSQQINANAQALDTMKQVLAAAAVPGVAQIPPVQLQPADVTPATPIFGDTGGGGGGD